MSLLPLPAGFSKLLALSSSANRSLVFDRGMDRYETGREVGIPAGAKEGFLKDFCNEYGQRRNPDFDAFVERRSAALKLAGAQALDFTTCSRLMIGLGLPHPIETGFLFDRLTGAIYLPGSSVKGMLRAAAHLVGEGKLEGDAKAWTKESCDRIFGPAIEPGALPKTGSLWVFDAFPVRWPRLEVDVLTPHFTRYYESKAVPADWESPNPVPLLTAPEGQVFRFHFASTDPERWEEDGPRIEALLALALDWLGIGGKKSSGYGRLTQGDLPERPVPLPLVEPAPEPKNPVLPNVLLQIYRGTPTVFRNGKAYATCRAADLAPELFTILKKSSKGVRADVEVVKVGSDVRIVAVPKWEPAK